MPRVLRGGNGRRKDNAPVTYKTAKLSGENFNQGATICRHEPMRAKKK